MRHAWPCAVLPLSLFSVAVLCEFDTHATAQYLRKTPIVEAVQKTKDAIVTVKVDKKGSGLTRKETTGTGVIVV